MRVIEKIRELAWRGRVWIANHRAGFYRMTCPEERPTVAVAGVLVALYVDAEERRVIVSVDLDTTATWLLRHDEDHTVPLQITVQGEPVFED
jgi:hypothetical protein